MSNLQSEIGSLSAAEKFELLDVLWESLESDALALTDEQRAELDFRVAKYESFGCHSVGASQGRPVYETVMLPVVWLPEADAELKEALARLAVLRRMVMERPRLSSPLRL